MKYSALSLVFLTACASTPVSVSIKGKSFGRSEGDISLEVELTLSNRSDRKMWILLPSKGSEPLPTSGRFFAAGTTGSPISARAWSTREGQVILVSFAGRPGFEAIRLPPQGRISIRHYRLYGTQPFNMIEVAEAESLRVNAEVELEDWLPHRSISDAPAEVTEDVRLEPMPIDPGKDRRLPTLEVIQLIDATYAGRDRIPLR